MQTKELASDTFHLFNLLEEEVLNELTAADWATQEFDAALLYPFDAALQGVCLARTNDLGTPDRGLVVVEVQSASRALPTHDFNNLLEICLFANSTPVVMEPTVS